MLRIVALILLVPRLGWAQADSAATSNTAPAAAATLQISDSLIDAAINAGEDKEPNLCEARSTLWMNRAGNELWSVTLFTPFYIIARSAHDAKEKFREFSRDVVIASPPDPRPGIYVSPPTNFTSLRSDLEGLVLQTKSGIVRPDSAAVETRTYQNAMGAQVEGSVGFFYFEPTALAQAVTEDNSKAIITFRGTDNAEYNLKGFRKCLEREGILPQK